VTSLDGTSVTDRGLNDLHGLKRLKQLSLRATRVTQAGIADLKGALPDLQVEN